MADAVKLAEDLIQGESLQPSNARKSAEVIAEEADCFPFYIHHIVAGLRKDGLPAEPDTIRELVRRHLVDANDPWDLGHYRTRIPAYYTQGQERTTRRPDPRRAGDRPGTDHRSAVAERDQLVVRGIRRQRRAGAGPPADGARPLPACATRTGAFGFRFPLIRRWWTLDRGL